MLEDGEGATLLIAAAEIGQTFGIPGVLGGSTNKLTIDDAEALRRIPGVDEVVPVVFGPGWVEGNGRGRTVILYGVGWEAAKAWRFGVAQGSVLPRMDPRRRSSYAVLGAKVAHELFGEQSPLGRRVWVGGWSLLVIGVMEPKGQLLGFDLDAAAYLPVATGLELFNLDELHEIDVVAASTEDIPDVAADMTRLLQDRHRGEDDFTITTQTEMMESFDRIIGIITIAVSGIAALLRTAVPGLPLSTPPEAVLAALAMSLVVGVASGVMPARRAATLDPIKALRAE